MSGFISASYMDQHKNVAYKPSTGLRTPDGTRFKICVSTMVVRTSYSPYNEWAAIVMVTHPAIIAYWKYSETSESHQNITSSTKQ